MASEGNPSAGRRPILDVDLLGTSPDAPCDGVCNLLGLLRERFGRREVCMQDSDEHRCGCPSVVESVLGICSLRKDGDANPNASGVPDLEHDGQGVGKCCRRRLGRSVSFCNELNVNDWHRIAWVAVCWAASLRGAELRSRTRDDVAGARPRYRRASPQRVARANGPVELAALLV